MSAATAHESPVPGVGVVCEQIRAGLDSWVPRMLGVYVRRSLLGPGEVAGLVAAVADAAEVTVLPADARAARAELRAAACRAQAATGGREGDVRAELTAVRAACRRAAVALGLEVPVTP